MLGGAYLPRSFMRRLIDVGAKQCASKEYDDALPNGMHILTNYIKETTDPHLDINPTTSKHINNDVGVVFLNTNEDAVFIVGNEEFPIEEGTLITFPGGSVPHHIEMKKKKGGFVHMLGPFEVGGSHGTVGHGSRKLSGHSYGSSCNRSAANSRCGYIVGGEVKFNSFDGEDANQESTNTSTSPSGMHVTGEVHVYGYINGTDPNGATNLTLEVQYNLEGLGTACNNGSCSVEVNTEADSSCDSLIDRVDESVGNRVLLTDLSQEGMGMVYVDIGTPIAQLFDRPMSVRRGSDGTVLN